LGQRCGSIETWDGAQASLEEMVVVRARIIWLAKSVATLLALCLALTACGTPISVDRLDARTVQTELTSNALTTGRLSESTQIVLRRLDLLSVYAVSPPSAIMALNQIVIADTVNRDLLFALAEIAFLEAERTNDRSYFLATVVYAYAFLFPTLPADRPNPFDPRLRAAADLYNRALTRAFATADGVHVELRGGDYPLPFGTLSVSFDQNALEWAGFRLTDFIPAAELHIEGLRNRYRDAGIGAPLAAALVPEGDPRGFQVARLLKVPTTALLRLDITPAAIASGRFTGRLILFTREKQRWVDIGGQKVPLENEPSAAFAFALSNPTIWKTELAGFFQGDLFENLPTQLFALEPYRPGRIPVVLIHGTASSAGRWADLINDLSNDPDIHDRFQFWLFTYNTGNPIALSALQLRTDLEAAINRLDPDRRDPALRNMVLIGHSQGGLLAKMLVIDAGSRLFDVISSKPIDELTLTPEARDTLRQALFVKPMPDVTRVIFIATPQRGSFVAGFSVAQLIARLVTLPLRATKLAAEMLVGNSSAMRLDPENTRIGSVFGMTPGSAANTAIASIPVAPTVKANSIIAVQGDGPVETGDDGVVQYSSAHIDEAESELVVRSGHSVQSNPKAVAEVRRILLLQWQLACPQGCATASETTTLAKRARLMTTVEHVAPAQP
jgi:pimeloyl-ACP methyl ester carboxylesterase